MFHRVEEEIFPLSILALAHGYSTKKQAGPQVLNSFLFIAQLFWIAKCHTLPPWASVTDSGQRWMPASCTFCLSSTQVSIRSTPPTAEQGLWKETRPVLFSHPVSVRSTPVGQTLCHITGIHWGRGRRWGERGPTFLEAKGIWGWRALPQNL